MEIQELWLKHYGKFHDHRVALKPGINIIYGGNESGKSTIHSFVRAMFFGLQRSRGKAARTDEYQIRQPWDTPGTFMGSMRIREDGKVYRIDRCFDSGRQSLALTCETDHAESSDPAKDLEKLLGGLSENAFANTFFISQAKCETDEALATELRSYMVNSENAMDAQLDVSQALQSLRRRKKAVEQKKKKEDIRTEEIIAKKQNRGEEIRRELELLKRYQPPRRENSYLWSDKSSPQSAYGPEEREDQKYTGIGKTILEIMLLAAGIAALVGAAVLTDWKVRVFLGIFGIVFLMMILPVYFLLVPEKEEAEDIQEDRRQEALYPDRESRGHVPGRMQSEPSDDHVTAQIRKLEAEYRSLQDELEQLYRGHVKLNDADTEIAALDMAIERICTISSGIYAKSSGFLNERASAILAELTGGKYTRIQLDELMEVRIHTKDRVLGLHEVSGGTMQQIYFAMRMAAGELLSEGRRLPVVLDETFAMYDDIRLEQALRWLKKSGLQVLMFTCQKREREILARISEK